MKALFISEFFPPFSKGGGERSALKLIEALSDRELECHVLTSRFENFKRGYIGNIRIYNYLFTSSKLDDLVKRMIVFPISTWFNLLKLHWKEKFDIVHCMNSTSIYAILLKPFIRAKFFIHVNSYVLLCPKGNLIYKDQTIRRECDIECSHYICQKCCKNSLWIGIHNAKITPKFATGIWIRYKIHIFLLKRFDGIFPISKQAENVLLRKGIPKEKIKQIYYGA